MDSCDAGRRPGSVACSGADTLPIPTPAPAERHRGPVTLRRGMVEATTTDQRLLDSRGPTDWVHTDPWRVLRIQSEFVEGFGMLAELGRAVSVFGSARTHREDPEYALGVRLGAALAEAGYAVITGGGPGAMEAANKGACEAGGTSVGLGIELPFEQGLNPWSTSGSTSATSSPARRCSSSTPRVSSCCRAGSAPSTSSSRRSSSCRPGR